MMSFRIRPGFSALMLMFALVLGTGCSDPDPVDITTNGELNDDDARVEQDNSPYDDYTFRAARGSRITIDMTSNEFDTYLFLLTPDGNTIQDDDGGEGTNSRISLNATAGGTYTVRANAFDDTGRGHYTLHMVARPNDASH